MQTSLELFEPLFIESANRLLDMLNDGVKNKKDVYHGQYVVDHQEYKIIVAANCADIEKALYNIVDHSGNVPNGFSANWRTASHIRQELNIKSEPA